LDGYDEAYCSGKLGLPNSGLGIGDETTPCRANGVDMRIRSGLIFVPPHEVTVRNETVTCEGAQGFVYNWTAFEIVYSYSNLKYDRHGQPLLYTPLNSC
jgi:hypothetical protein